MMTLAVSWLLALGALAGVVRVYGLPTEARVHDTWYAYQQELRFQYTAHVRPGDVYEAPVQRPEDLVQLRLPVEPPAFRRVLAGKLTDRIELSLPYTFRADRPADIRAAYRLEARLVTPLWQRPMPLGTPEQVQVRAQEITLGQASVSIPIRDIIRRMESVAADVGVQIEVAELHIRPVAEVEVAGLREPVRTGLAPQFTVNIRSLGAVVEVDEPRVVKDEKTLQSTAVVPVTLPLGPWQVPVATLRALAVAAFALCTGGTLTLWVRMRRRRAALGSPLDRLGPALIHAHAFEPSPELVVVDVASPRELLALHVQSERPVIRVGNTYYLIDGSTCYRLVTGGQ